MFLSYISKVLPWLSSLHPLATWKNVVHEHNYCSLKMKKGNIYWLDNSRGFGIILILYWMYFPFSFAHLLFLMWEWIYLTAVNFKHVSMHILCNKMTENFSPLDSVALKGTKFSPNSMTLQSIFLQAQCRQYPWFNNQTQWHLCSMCMFFCMSY